MAETSLQRGVRQSDRMVAAAIEALELRQLMCIDHLGGVEPPLTLGMPAAPSSVNMGATVARPAGSVMTVGSAFAPGTTKTLGAALQPMNSITSAGTVSAADFSAATSAIGTSAVAGVTFAVNAAGLPLLTSRADGGGLKVFLDFDGYGTDTSFSTDADGATFNTSEQTNIVETFRDIVSYFSTLDVNITTIQPPTGGSNPAFVWHRISNSISGGAAYVGWVTNDRSNSWTGADGGTSRHSGIAHEIGHQLGLSHQAEWDQNGAKVTDYTDGFGVRDRAIIGVDFAENVRTWFFGRNSDGPDRIVDDLTIMSNSVKSYVGGDGYRADDFAGTTASATPIDSTGMIAGRIERNNDVDVFKLVVTTARTYQIDATPTFESAVSPKIELLNSSGTVIAARDDADRRNTNNNDQEFSRTLSAGTYYVRVASSGDAGEQGEYLLTAAPLLNGYTSQDINDPFRAGTAAYNPSTNTLRQLGGGTDIWGNSDQFRFTSQVLTGNGSITARIDEVENVDGNTKVGVMIRQSLAPNSASVYAGILPSGNFEPIVRSTAGGPSGTVDNPANLPGPWVRLTRVGNNFTFDRSTDGTNWSNFSAATVAMTGPVYIGFATGSRRPRMAAWSTFSHIAVTGTLGTSAPATNGLAAPGSVAAAPLAGANTSVKITWGNVSGETGFAVQRSVDGVTFTDAGTVGANVLSYTDANQFGSMRYFYRVLSLGSGAARSVASAVATTINKPSTPGLFDTSYAQPTIALSATAVGLNWTDVQGDEGYRIERSSNGGATYATIATTPKNNNAYNDTAVVAGTAYTYRISPVTSVGDKVTGALIIGSETKMAAPANFKIASRSTTAQTLTWTDLPSETGYRLERSTDNTNWSTRASLGAGVTSYADTGLAAGTEYYYRLTGTKNGTDGFTTAVAFGTVAASGLPSGWTDTDIGTAGGAGTAKYNSGTGTFTVIGNGFDTDGTADSVHYVYKAVTGDAQIVARVTGVELTSQSAKGGLMIRQDLTPGSKTVAVGVSPFADYGIDAHTRTAAGAGAVYQSILRGVTAPYWLKMNRTGDNVTSSYSTDGVNWTLGSTTTLPLTGTFYVGLSVTAYNNAQLNTSTFTNVDVTGTVTPPTGTGTISGKLFGDGNKNGVFDAGDVVAANRTVWLDLDDDGVLDSNEKSVLSDGNGNYTFSGLAARTYHVRRVFPSGYIESTPARYVTVTAAGGTFSNVSIGSKLK